MLAFLQHEQRMRMRAALFMLTVSLLSGLMFVSQGWAQDAVPDVPPLESDEAPVHDQIESLSESYNQVLGRLQQLIEENEELSKRLSAVESKPSKKDDEKKETFTPPSFALQALYDSFHPLNAPKSKPWYEKLSIRGYSQFRFGRAVSRDPDGGPPGLLGDASISDKTGTFSIRRARLILSGDMSDHVSLYFQSDFANNPADGPNTFFAQIRDLYADIYIDTTRVNRFRIGQSKLPWGFEEMQSSGNRAPLDRSDAIDSGDSPNQRDLGLFYYWTPEDKQKLLKDLVDGGLKGSGNYGIFAIGIYNGQGGSQLDQNKNLHAVTRFTWPFQLESGQAVEMSVQAYAGKKVVDGTLINPLGGAPDVPTGTDDDGHLEQRLAGSFIWYPQPWGFQSEWNVGQGPGLNDAQTAVEVRNLQGGYAMALYKLDTACHGIFFPYTRYQYYRGGYRSLPNAPYGTQNRFDLGVEWQIRKELEIVFEYSYLDAVSLTALTDPGAVSYMNFRGSLLRTQLQINY